MSDGSREDVKGDSSNNQKSEHNGAHKGRRQARKALMNFLKASLDVEGSEPHILKSFSLNVPSNFWNIGTNRFIEPVGSIWRRKLCLISKVELWIQIGGPFFPMAIIANYPSSIWI